jgi:vacuolar protein sorting-associated protein 13A/C
VVLVNNKTKLATLSLSTALVSILLRNSGMRITGRLGSLSLLDNSLSKAARPEFKEIMSIEGENFADFTYQTFEGEEKEAAGFSSQFTLLAASVKLHFVEDALQSIYAFLIKLANLKGLYDAATQAAVQRASEIQRLQFDISVKSPIIVFPTNPASSPDAFTMRLGEIHAKNLYNGPTNKTTASLHGIRLASCLHNQETLKIVDDIDIDADILQTVDIDRSKDLDRPDTQVNWLLYLLEV